MKIKHKKKKIKKHTISDYGRVGIEESARRSDKIYCTEPGCHREARCAKLNPLTKQPIPNQLCITHWESHYNKKHPVGTSEDTPGGRITKTGKFVRAPIKKGSVGKAVNDLIDKKGVDKVTFEEMKDTVLAIKADSKFNRNHYNWYRNQYKKKNK